jgi:hypothetical protein
MVILEGFRAYTKTTRFLSTYGRFQNIFGPNTLLSTFLIFLFCSVQKWAFVMSAPEFSDRSPSAGLAGLHGAFSLQISHALSKIISNKNQHSKLSQLPFLVKPDLFTSSQQAKDRKVSVKKAVELLAKGNIPVDEDEAGIILDFLYLVAKFSRRSEGKINNDTLSGNRTLKKAIQAFVY